MNLTIGKVSKLFGLSPETLRYYESEGFLSPKKKTENGYREYSFQDIFLLTDLLFYRDIGIPIKDIRQIFDGIGVDEITDLIAEKKADIREKIALLEDSLTKLENWDDLHREALEYLGKFDVRPMPPALCTRKKYEDYSASFTQLKQKTAMKKNLAFFLTLSFYCDFRECSSPSIKQYVILDKSVSRNLDFTYTLQDAGGEIVEEKAERCLFSIVKYSGDPNEMLSPFFQYAKEQGLKLSGEFFGRQSINYYGQKDSCIEYYRVYGVLSD